MNEKEIFEGITILYTEKLVQITTDTYLIQYLNKKGKKDASTLATHILNKYKELMKTPLKISKDSLAVEILIHVYFEQLADILQSSSPLVPKELKQKLNPLLSKIKSHTEIIDCGEKSVDSNRHIFDSLAPFVGIITFFLEK